MFDSIEDLAETVTKYKKKIERLNKKIQQLEKQRESLYNKNELEYIAVNYAILSMKGYDKTFDDWFNNINKQWRGIANSKNKS